MPGLLRTLTATGLALAAVASFAIPAMATRAIELTPAGTITKRVEAFTIRPSGSEVTITCMVILRGQLSTTIEKASARRLPAGNIGQILAAEVIGCRTNFGTEAEVTILVSGAAPFNLRYEAFTGTLPEITGIIFRKLGFALQVREPLIIGTCLFRGPVNLLMTLPPVEGGAMGRYNPEVFQTPNALASTGGMLCPESVQISGAGRVQNAQIGLLRI